MYSPVLHSLIVYYYTRTLKKFNNASSNLAVIFFQTFPEKFRTGNTAVRLIIEKHFPKIVRRLAFSKTENDLQNGGAIVIPSSSGHHPTGESAMDRS